MYPLLKPVGRLSVLAMKLLPDTAFSTLSNLFASGNVTELYFYR